VPSSATITTVPNTARTTGESESTGRSVKIPFTEAGKERRHLEKTKKRAISTVKDKGEVAQAQKKQKIGNTETSRTKPHHHSETAQIANERDGRAVGTVEPPPVILLLDDSDSEDNKDNADEGQSKYEF
jgi:competence protein ComGC